MTASAVVRDYEAHMASHKAEKIFAGPQSFPLYAYRKPDGSILLEFPNLMRGRIVVSQYELRHLDPIIQKTSETIEIRVSDRPGCISLSGREYDLLKELVARAIEEGNI